MLVELHSHTTHSRGRKIFYDGINKPEEMVRHAAQMGLDAITITDHDVITGALGAKKFQKKYNIRVFTGEEISTASGHVLGIGIQERVKPGLSVPDTVDKIHQQGGIAVSPHPFDINNDGINDEAIHCDAFEIFNGIGIDRIGNFKARRFYNKTKMPITAGSDAHFKDMIGHGMISGNFSDIDSMIKAIKKRRINIHAKYPSALLVTKLAVERLKMSYDHVWDHIDKNYHGPKRALSKRMLKTVRGSPCSFDLFFKGLTYFSLGMAILYTGTKEVGKFFHTR